MQNSSAIYPCSARVGELRYLWLLAPGDLPVMLVCVCVCVFERVRDGLHLLVCVEDI